MKWRYALIFTAYAFPSKRELSKYVDSHEKTLLLEQAKKEAYVLKSVDEKRFEIFYQEKHDARENKVVGVEALARLRDDGGFISPAEFVRTIEESDRIAEFGFLVIELVFAQVKRLYERYGPIRVSINLSPKQLADYNFLVRLESLVAAYGIRSELIELEITETVLMSNFSELLDIMHAAKNMGFKFSMDDFGTGYSSLSYLSVLPIDVIKIDKSFIDKIATDNAARAIVRSVIDIAREFNLEVVAEGVETEDQLDRLKSLGCHIIQGYLFSRPKTLG